MLSCRLSGYILFPLVLFTVHLGGAWSTWGSKYASWSVRFLAYTVGPLGIILGVYARVRWVDHFFTNITNRADLCISTEELSRCPLYKEGCKVIAIKYIKLSLID